MLTVLSVFINFNLVYCYGHCLFFSRLWCWLPMFTLVYHFTFLLYLINYNRFTCFCLCSPNYQFLFNWRLNCFHWSLAIKKTFIYYMSSQLCLMWSVLFYSSERGFVKFLFLVTNVELFLSVTILIRKWFAQHQMYLLFFFNFVVFSVNKDNLPNGILFRFNRVAKMHPID